MALFPAFAGQIQASGSNDEVNSQSWLENSSFPTPKNSEELHQLSAGSSLDELNKIVPEITPPPKKKRKKHHSKTSPKKSAELPKKVNEDFYVDVSRTPEFLNVTTISRPSAPRYFRKYYIYNGERRRKKRMKRYFRMKKQEDCDKSNSETEVITQQNIDKIGASNPDESYTGFKQEEDLSKTTSYFNKTLADNSHDIQTWLKYVHFQDTVYQFEKMYKKGSIAKGLRVTAERKLAILDKALTENPNCEELLRERLNIAVSVYPADELQTHLGKFVKNDEVNIILWQGYIEATQCSMSHCNTSAVIKLYSDCLATLNKHRRISSVDRPLLEENILHMLYQCGLFLKQAGLFERLWTLIRLYLELNISPFDPDKFNLAINFNEKQLIELEEVVFNSQLPIHELWLRIEKLRESCHWLPLTGEDCEDPQRLVFNEDVIELIHPITMQENLFKFTALVLTLLKLPLLPCRHVTMADLGLDYVPWAFDSVEVILPAFFNLYHIDVDNKNFCNDNRLAIGPQYLKVLPGREEYLEFLLKVIKNCIDCLSGKDKQALTIWWFRFQRLLLILGRQNRFKIEQPFKKKIKQNIKNILKETEHRSNIQFYCEYALVEKELNDVNSGIDVLAKMLSVNRDTAIVYKPTDSQMGICHMYRHLIELLLLKNEETSTRKALLHIVNYVRGQQFSPEPKILTQGALNEAVLAFNHVTLQLLQEDITNPTPGEQFLPNYLTDWIILNGYFVYLTKDAIECGVFIEGILTKLDEKVKGKSFHKEILYEFYVSVMYSYCNTKCGYFKLLDELLYRVIELYPNNMFVLSVLAKQQSRSLGLGFDWWKPKSVLMKTGRALPIIFIILISNQKIIDLCETAKDSITGIFYEMNGNLKNKMLAQFRQITKSDMCTRRCGLIWRLFLQFVHAYFTPTMCRNVYYNAVEECPWLKALYIDAAIYIPAELAQIQDLIIEKQLRIHVTPEELDILRN